MSPPDLVEPGNDDIQVEKSILALRIKGKKKTNRIQKQQMAKKSKIFKWTITHRHITMYYYTTEVGNS